MDERSGLQGDSALERNGLELSVPWSRDRQTVVETGLAVSKTGAACRGTEGSNPSPSSAESNANLTFRSPSYRAAGPDRLILPAMQQGKQPFWARLQLLARLTLNPGKHTADKPGWNIGCTPTSLTCSPSGQEGAETLGKLSA